MVGELKYVYEFAQSIMKKLKYKKIANCKELSKRILKFEINDLEEKIEDNLKTMEDFLFHSYKGFYCTICNYQNHKFFNIENK